MAEAKNRNLYDFVADMPYGITGQEKIVASFAPRISDKQLSQIFLWHKGEPIKKYYTGYSLEFSLEFGYVGVQRLTYLFCLLVKL